MPINEYDEILASGKPAASNEYMSLIADESGSEGSELVQSMNVAVKKQPDRQARVMELSKETKLPPRIVENNFDTIEQKARAGRNDYAKLAQESPKTASWLSNPNNASIAHDDIDNLKKVESHVRRLKPTQDTSLTGDLWKASKTGFHDLSAGTHHTSMLYGVSDPREAAERAAEANRASNEIRESAPDYAKDFTKMLGTEIQDVNEAFSQFTSSYESAREGEILKALTDFGVGGTKTVGQILDLVGESVAGRRRLKGLMYSGAEQMANMAPILASGAVGTAVAGPIGGAAATFASGTGVEIGAWMNQEIAANGYDITNADSLHEAYTNQKLMGRLKKEAELKGMTTAGLDTVMFLFTGGVFRGARKATKAASEGVVKKVGKKAGMVTADMVQEGVGEFAGQGVATGGDLERMNLGESVFEGVSSLGHSAGQTAISGGVKGVKKGIELKKEYSKNPVVAAEQVSSETLMAVEAQKAIKDFETLGEIAVESKTAGRSKDAIADIINHVASESENQSVFFQSEDWDSYWQARDESPVEKAKELLGDDKAYYEAKANGTQLEFDMGKYVSEYAGSEHYEGLLNTVRMEQDGHNLRESNQFLKELPQQMELIADAAVTYQETLDVARVEAKEIEKEVATKLKDVNLDPKQAVMIAEAFRSQALNMGVSVKELWAEYNINVSRESGVTGATGETVMNQTDENAKPFFSKLQKTLDEKIQGKVVSADQIKGLTKEIKPEELKWSGLDKFLEGKKKVDKAELLDFLRANELQVDDVTLGEVTENEVAGEYHIEAGPEDSPFPYAVKDWAGNNLESFKTEGEAEAFIENQVNVELPTKFQDYTLPGGENYREVLFTMPPKPVSTPQSEIDRLSKLAKDGDKRLESMAQKITNLKRALLDSPLINEDERGEVISGVRFSSDIRRTGVRSEEQQASFDDWRKVLSSDAALLGLFDEAAESIAEQTSNSFESFQAKNRLNKIAKGEADEVYAGGHFDQKNILAHVRLNDRTDADGKRVLFVEEIQSDWHQAGRKKGYKENVKPITELPDGYKVTEYKDAFNVQGPEGRIMLSGASSKSEAISRTIEKLNREAGGGLVPDAPFKKTWHEFALKKIVRMAAEQGYERVAWTTGEQQAERYDLSKQVREIEYIKHDDGYELGVTSIDGDGVSGIPNRVNENNLEDYVGKEIAKKIVDGEGKKYRGHEGYTLEGLDLKVGGEGMKGFYDNILVKSANKMFKKYGVKVGENQVPEKTGFAENVYEGPDLSSEEILDIAETQGSKISEQLLSYSHARHNSNQSVAEASRHLSEVSAEAMGGILAENAEQRGLPAHSIEITDKLKDAVLNQGQPLFQADDKTTRGQIRFANKKFNIELLKDANLSTFLHEMGHFFLEFQGDIIDSGKASEKQQADYSTLLEFLGVNSREEIKTEHHEKFARSFEAYLMEGKAPSAKLKKIFNKFRIWLTSVYPKLKTLVQLTPEVRDVMDRLFVAEIESKQATQDMGDGRLFEDPLLFGMGENQARAYLDAYEDAEDATREHVIKKLMDAKIAKQTKEYKAVEKRIKDEATEQVNNSVLYKAISLLQHGKLPDGTVPDGWAGKPKLSRQVLVKLYDADFVKNKLPRPFIYAREGGMHPDIMAGILGFESGDDMINQIANAPTRKKAVQAQVDAQLFLHDTHSPRPDLLKSPQISEAAIEAYHNEKRAALKRMELEHLASNNMTQLKGVIKKISKRVPSNKQVGNEAKRIISEMKVSDVKPNTYKLAERRASKEAGEMLASGEIEAAFEAKQRELMNYYLYREATDAKQFVEKETKKLKRFFKKDEKLAKTRDVDFINAGRAVLARYGLGVSDKEPMSYLRKLAEYNPDLFETVSAVIETILEKPDNYKNIQFGKFTDLVDSLDALWSLSKEVKQIELDGKKVDLHETIDTLIAEMQKFKKDKPKEKYARTATQWEKHKLDLLHLKSHVMRLEHWADLMDMGDIEGPFRTVIFEQVSSKITDFDEASTARKKQIVELSKPIAKSMDLNKKIISTDLEFEFKNKAEVLGALLHSGNPSSLKKLLIGREWGHLNDDQTLNDDNWRAFERWAWANNILTKADYDYIQAIWDIMEELKPDANKSHKKLKGFFFDEIAVHKVSTPWGEYRGGYAPAQVDPYAVTDIARRQELEAFVKSHPSNTYPASGGMGMTKSRVDNFNKPLSLEIKLVLKHLEDVLRLTHIKPAVADVAKVVMNTEFREAMAEIDPKAIDVMIIPALNRADKNTAQLKDPSSVPIIKKFGGILKANSSMNLMFANLPNTAEQAAGITMAMTQVEPKFVMRSMGGYMRHPRDVAKWVNESSKYMSLRTDDQVFEMSKAAAKIFEADTALTKTQDWASQHAYFSQAFTQNIVDNTVWAAAYDESMSKKMNHDMAVRKADSVVRMTQGSRRALDVSAVESVPHLAFFQMFMNFFNMVLNLNYGNFAKLYYEDLGLKQKAAKFMYLFLMGYASVAVISGAIRKAAAGGLDEDEDGEYLDDMFDVLIGSQVDLFMGMIPVAGTAINAGLNWANDKPYDDRASASPAIQALTTIAGTATNVATGKFFDDKGTKREVRDGLTALGILTGTPLRAISKPITYGIDVSKGKARPSGPIDAARGIITGRPGVK